MSSEPYTPYEAARWLSARQKAVLTAIREGAVLYYTTVPRQRYWMEGGPVRDETIPHRIAKTLLQRELITCEWMSLGYRSQLTELGRKVARDL